MKSGERNQIVGSKNPISVGVERPVICSIPNFSFVWGARVLSSFFPEVLVNLNRDRDRSQVSVPIPILFSHERSQMPLAMGSHRTVAQIAQDFKGRPRIRSSAPNVDVALCSPKRIWSQVRRVREPLKNDESNSLRGESRGNLAKIHPNPRHTRYKRGATPVQQSPFARRQHVST